LTSGYDNSARVWDGTNLELIAELNGHEKMVMKLDISSDEKSVMTCSYDRTWKLWCWETRDDDDDGDVEMG
jgi:U4/U6 small nuclear ribonucleoprotein PRP4